MTEHKSIALAYKPHQQHSWDHRQSVSQEFTTLVARRQPFPSCHAEKQPRINTELAGDDEANLPANRHPGFKKSVEKAVGSGTGSHCNGYWQEPIGFHLKPEKPTDR